MFEVIKKAKVKSADVAKLLHISRVTVSLWVNGHASPHKLILPRVKLLLDAIQACVDNGTLPLPSDTKRVDRYKLTTELIEQQVVGMGYTMETLSGRF